MTIKRETYKIRNPYQRKMREDRFYNLRVEKDLKKQYSREEKIILEEGLEEYYSDEDEDPN